jgi:hypothetical protein
MEKIQLLSTNHSDSNSPTECDASVASAAAADDTILDLASLRLALGSQPAPQRSAHRAARVYALVAVGWIMFLGNLVWIAVAKQRR